MCLPLGFLRFLLIPVACTLMIISLYTLVALQIDDISDGTALYTSYISSGVLFIIAMLGIIGGCCNIKVANTIYACLLFLFALFFAFAFVYILILSDVFAIACSTQAQLNQLALLAQSELCSDACVCKIDQGVFTQEYIQSNNLTHSDTSKIVQYQECPNVQTDQRMVNMRNYELTYKCSGWCAPAPIFLFTDVNQGIPSQSCYKALYTAAVGKDIELLYILGFLCLFVLMVSCFSCCMVLHPGRNSKPFYQPINYKFKIKQEKVQDQKNRSNITAFSIQA